ncbi:MAG: 50S ribosomal protein L13 [Candidatus Anstonellales archaeon]
MKIYDCEGLILGRAATQIAKEIIKGEEVAVVNCEKMLISNPEFAEKRYKQKRSLQYKADPEKSPKYPKIPHLFVKKSISGMVPRKKMKGRNALKKLMVYEGVPEEFKGKEMLSIEAAKVKNEDVKYITVYELCKKLGWNNA